MVKNGNSRVFYGYIIVIAAFFIVLIMHGMESTYGIFFNPLQAEFGWTRATISGARSLASILMGLFAIAAGRLTDRFGPRITITICGLVLGLGYYLTSQANTVWQLYLFYGVIVGIGTSGGDVSLLSTTARWFVRRRGMMTGMVKVGTGIGLLVMPLVASRLISNHGWRNSYLILGIVSMVVITSVAQFLKRDPSQKGLEPYGGHEGDVSGSDSTGGGLSSRQAIHTRQFWTVCATYFLIWYCSMAIMVHIAPRAIDLGISATRAASMLSTIGGVSILARLAIGSVGDKVGNRRALVIWLLILIAAVSLLQFARQLWTLYLFAAVYGFAHGGLFTVGSPLTAELFGTRSHGAIFGMSLFAGQVGGAIGSVVTGRIFDITGSYRLAFLVLIAISITAFILATRLRPIGAKEKINPYRATR